jgi:dTDP-4-dehydrorhamnose 3,5-epimerase/CDP-3, 6-dideoxy-D-glycero-D-glycero-4-hexulose-5-epimerase
MGGSMNVVQTELDGVQILEPKIFRDDRGEFVKTFNREIFTELGLPFELAESYYSTSKKDVIRGMHFQTPPHAHTKIVYVSYGSITDVILDVRKDSATYGKFVTVSLSDENRKMVYIPIGFAHGFIAHQDDTCVEYLQTSGYAPHNDGGVRFDSFGMDWGVDEPIMSDRDKAFPALPEFESPFLKEQQ